VDYSTPLKVRLDDKGVILDYYSQILRAVQQLCLKHVLKEWIKIIEPKKQKNHPYKRKDGVPPTRPGWWPDDATYKEPDHIKVDGEFWRSNVVAAVCL
jgi:hypothetical protein